ncbi:putative motility protein [Vreelandella jeotgali]|uniref:putative motility protein n=1 Tax=Vreelandella jeotgali TaxID=553386 RepID=UPI000345C9B5|nr:putative motility protein [Halomonas jeotgali]
MDASVSNMVSQSLYLNQAQTAQQAQMQILRESLDTQQQQVTQLMESASTGGQMDLATEGSKGTQVNTYA